MGGEKLTQEEIDHYQEFQKLSNYYHKMLLTLHKTEMDMGPDDIDDIQTQIESCLKIMADIDEETRIRETRSTLNLIVNKLALSSQQSRLQSINITIVPKTFEDRLTYCDKNILRAMGIAPE